MVKTLRNVALTDKYSAPHGTVLLSGTQALVRLLLLQREIDRARGLKTAGYVSGYRGSPLGGLDQQLWAARESLAAADVVFEPGVNEDLAATAVWGTQQVPLLPGATVQGVFSLWYGKGPGVDRSGDPIKHGNRMGTSPYGGVLLAVGDDHAGKSSTVAHQSEQALAANGVPVLYPATVQEYLDFGLLGWALSRHAGVWVALKCVNHTVETTATVDVGVERVSVVVPDPAGSAPAGLHARIGFDPLGDDVRLHRYKLPAAQQFVRANGLDRVVLKARSKRLGVVAAGKSFLDTSAALHVLGIDESRASLLGVSLYKPGMIWPLEPQRLREFARGCEELLVIEEKEAFLEPQIASILFNMPIAERPRLVGKFDQNREPLQESDVAFDSSDVALLIAARLASIGVRDAQVAARAAEIQRCREQKLARAPAPVSRPPYFCSGCPHNTSTRVPEGSMAMSGIGCHTMAMGMDRHTLPPTHMGGEGMTWAGIAPFTTMTHVFQNLGDGTYFHSGLLAIRGAVAAGVNITYKLLVNDAVAMTGGQRVEGNLSIAEISRQLADERVRKIAVVSDEPQKWRAAASSFAPGVTLHERDELETLQLQFRELPGVTAIIYEQTCAAEKRRRRKRGKLPDPARRVFINSSVCEGCGDCSQKSNCVSIEPLETEFGRKRRIDQSSCNKDYSCINGFCPSFVLIEGGSPRKPDPAVIERLLATDLPAPHAFATTPFNAVIAGVGGTGVVTIGAVLAMAAHLEGRQASVFDMTGLAQKGGAVLSHLRIDVPGTGAHSPGIQMSEADMLLACDLVVAAGKEAIDAVDPLRTTIVANSHVIPVSQFQRSRDFDFHTNTLRERLRAAVECGRYHEIDASEVAERLLGSALATQLILLGYAFQGGLLPVGGAAIERAIELNGAAVELNRKAFRLGRLLRHDPAAVLSQGTATVAYHETPVPNELEAVLAPRVNFLTAYQDSAYTGRYRALVDRVRAAEQSLGKAETLSLAVARNYFKLLAYKDEYEVARLHTQASFRATLQQQLEGKVRIKLLLAPPLLARRDPITGEPRKREFGPWIFPLLRILTAARRLRGTHFDPFGRSPERKQERQLIVDYETTITTLLSRLSVENYVAAVDIAMLPDEIRGFGPVKDRSITAVLPRWRELVTRYIQESTPC